MVKNPRSSKATTCMQHGGRVSKTTSAESKDCCVCVCVFVLFSDSFFWLEKGGVPAPRTYKVQAGLFGSVGTRLFLYWPASRWANGATVF